MWKVLILDSFNENINSSHFKIKDLRAANITICFKLKQERQQLHGVTAIYILQPTMENIEIIVKDFTLDLYSSVHIHFSAEPSTHVLSSLAKNLAKARPGSYSKINKVEYSGIGYLCLDHQLAIVPENSSLINIIVALK